MTDALLPGQISLLENGEPARTLEHPVAWPTFTGYPANTDQDGAPIDYAVSRYGGPIRSMPKPHPDLVSSRAHRQAASDPTQYNQSTRCRHPPY